jgi:DNA-binding XRE family transcriptional regulator
MNYANESRLKLNHSLSGYVGLLIQRDREGVILLHTPNQKVRLGNAIASSGISKKALAKKAGLTPSALSRIISGEVKPRPATAAALARALGTTPAALFPKH